MDDLLKFLALNGQEIMMHSIKCGLWLEVHPTCEGCPYELGCLKFSVLQKLSSRSVPLQLKINIAKATSIEEVSKLNPFQGRRKAA